MHTHSRREAILKMRAVISRVSSMFRSHSLRLPQQSLHRRMILTTFHFNITKKATILVAFLLFIYLALDTFDSYSLQ